MKPEPKYINVSAFDPSGSLFLVALKTKNIPGALGDIATRIGKAGVNILSTSNYAIPGKKESMISFIAGSPKPDTTEDEVRKIVAPSQFVLDTYVKKSASGFLVDDFAYPLMYFPAGRGVLFPATGIGEMFKEIVKVFGTGGETILFRAGYSMGRQGTEELVKLFGEDSMLEDPASYTGLFGALGWGRLELASFAPDFSQVSLKLFDGFESSMSKSPKPICHFSRGLIAGSLDRLLGKESNCEEVQCVQAGARILRLCPA